MATNIAIGFSRAFEPAVAFKEAATHLKAQLNQPLFDLLVILMTPSYAKPEVLQVISRTLVPRRVIGTITPDIIVDGRIEPRGIAILGMCSDDIHIGTGFIEQTSFQPPRTLGSQIGRTLMSDLDVTQRYGALLFLNASRKNTTQISWGLSDSLGHSFLFTGVIPCDRNLQDVPIIFEDKFISDSFAGIIWGGQTSAAVSARHGFRPLGRPRMITHSEGNLIRTIDHQPAIDIYKNYFKSSFANPITTPHSDSNQNHLGDIGLLYPLGISTSEPRQYSIRHVVEVLNDGSLLCQAEIPADTRVHLMISDKDACRKSAHDAAIEIREQLGGKQPKLVFITESYVRRKLFGRTASIEFSTIKDILGLTVPMIGMYTYGEIAPFGQLKDTPNTQPQSASIVLTALG